MIAVSEDAKTGELDQDDVEDDTEQDTTAAPVQYDITSYGADYDVEGLVKRINRGDILIPDFQRNYVWSQKEASKFIESLLLGLPVPGVFLVKENDSNKLLVIDGQQRLKTLQFFYAGFFNPSVNDSKRTVFRLMSVQPKFEGLAYLDLDERDRTRLNDSLIHATIIRQDTPSNENTSIYHIFDRLNSYGRRLVAQEIRTATDHGPFIDLIKQLNEYPNWRKLFGPKNLRLKDQEMILRFFALYHDGQNYQKPMNNFLNQYSARHRRASEMFLTQAQDCFCNVADVVAEGIGRNAFRPLRSFNAAVFDSVFVGLAKRLEDDQEVDLAKVRLR